MATSLALPLSGAGSAKLDLVESLHSETFLGESPHPCPAFMPEPEPDPHPPATGGDAPLEPHAMLKLAVPQSLCPAPHSPVVDDDAPGSAAGADEDAPPGHAPALALAVALVPACASLPSSHALPPMGMLPHAEAPQVDDDGALAPPFPAPADLPPPFLGPVGIAFAEVLSGLSSQRPKPLPHSPPLRSRCAKSPPPR